MAKNTKSSKSAAKALREPSAISGNLQKAEAKAGHLPTTDTSNLIQPMGSSNYRAETRKPTTVVNEQLMRQNSPHITPVRNRLVQGRREKFYFLTVPGLLRFVELFFSLLHITLFGFYGTFFEKELDFVVSPFFVAAAREQFFLMANFNSFMGSIVMVFSGIFSSTSNTALISSLYPFVFDLIQFLLIFSAGVSILSLYRTEEAGTKMKIGLKSKDVTGFTGIFLSILHLISALYDLVVFIRRWEKEEDTEED